ncbi:MAG: hypothetical protein E7Z63_04875 [Thermoplasmata archaeon]|nr:hypothetical protein [Thermoplasmata archaeon]
MRRIATGDTEAEKSAVKSAPRSDKGTGSWLKVHWCLVSLAVIMVLAFVLRVVFAYGISAGDDYALSGGTSASSHLRIVIELLAGTYDPSSQPQLNYPYGIESVSGPLYDYIMAGFAYLVTLCGVSDSTAASGVMAWSSPIIGVLTAIPVFMVAKRIYDDDVVAVVSALVYEFTALVIMVTPFSYGGEYALLGFISAFMVYFLVSAIKVSDEQNLTGFLCVLQRDVFFYAILAGIFYGLVIHTWTEFRVIAVVAAVIVAISLVVTRIKGRDMGAIVGISTVFLLFGTFIGAAYYLPFGLWDDVFSGGCLIALFTVLYSVVFLLLAKKPWIVTIPLMAAVIIVVGVALHFVLPDIADAIFKGNSAFEGGLVSELAESFTRSSISAMATWFGWLTVWMSFALGAYMLVRYRKDGGKRLYGFVMLWMLSMFFIGWFDSGYAYFSAVAMAIGAAYVMVTVLRAVDLPAYFAGLKTIRGSGFKGAAKKVFSFFPFVTIVVIAVLVIVPNAVYAFDAATPTNDEKSGYYGGLGYTINTSDATELSSAWNHYSDVDKDGALLAWYGYTDSAAVFGGFSTVTSPYGNGSAAMSTAYLQDGSSGALVSMSVRLLDANQSKVAAAVSGSGLTVIDSAKLSKILSDNSYCDEILADTDYAKLNLDDSLRPYYAAFVYLTETCALGPTQLCALYDSVCNVTGEKISYIEVDSSMLPIAYNDNSSMSTIAYLGGYDVTSTGVSPFYTVNNYTGYAYYDEAMYSTLVYQALIGCTPSEAGQSYSISLLSELSASDGDVKPMPAKGLTGFAVDYWHVMYNADSEATGSSDGWKDMDAYEAIALQNEKGGLINYISSVMMLKYVGVSAAVSGTVTMASGDALPGATVNVYSKTDFDSTGAVDYVLYSSADTDADGKYAAAIPASGAFKVVLSTSAGKNADGNVLETVYYDSASGSITKDFSGYADSRVSGAITNGNEVSGTVGVTGVMSMKLQGSDIEYKVDVQNGSFDTEPQYASILPGTYDISVFTNSGTAVGTATLKVMPGHNEDIAVKVTSYAINITVTHQDDGTTSDYTEVTVLDTASNTVVCEVMTKDDGKAVAYVPAGTYSVFVSGSTGEMSLTPSKVTVGSSAQSVTLNVVDSETLEFTVAGDADKAKAAAICVDSYAFSTAAVNGVAYVPAAVGITSEYFAYVTIGGESYYGSGSSGTIDLVAKPSFTISGTVSDDSGDVAGANVFIEGADFFTRVVADSNGQFDIMLPTSADGYLLYAKSGSKYYFENIPATADIGGKSIELVSGTEFTYTLNYYTGMSPSTRAIPYAGIFSAAITADSASYTLSHLMTGSDGKVSLALPTGYSVVMTAACTETDYMYIGDEGDTDFTTASLTSSGTLYVQRTEPTSRSASYGMSHVKTVTGVTVTTDVGSASDYNGKMTNTSSSSTTYDVVNGVITGDVVPGNYTFEMDGAYFYDGTVSVYPGQASQTAVFASKPFQATKVEVTVSEGDTVTLEKSDDDALSHQDHSGNTYTYHLQKDDVEEYTYIIKAADSDGKVAYCFVDETGAASATDLTAKSTVVKVSGNLGVSASGTVYAMDGTVILRSSITGGSYSLSLPVGKDYVLRAELDKDAGSSHYEYSTDDFNLSIPADATEDIVFNFAATTSDITPAENDYVSLTSATVNGEEVTMTLELTYNGDATGMTMIVTGLSGLSLNETYSAYVANGSSASLTVAGVYNSRLHGAGDSLVGVSVQDTTGSELGTVSVPADAYPEPSDAVKVKLTKAAEGAGVADAVNGYSYRYALSIANDNAAAVKVTVDGALSAASDSWKVYIADADSNVVYEAGEAFVLDGKTTSVYYLVVFSKADYTAADVPSVTYTVTAETMGGSAVTIEGDASSGSMEHATVKVDQSGGSAADGGASDEGKKLSTLFYGLVVVLVLLVLLFVWAASKRGVFSRN